MDIETLKSASLKINKEVFSLNPSSLITLFEIDISDIAFDSGFVSEQDIVDEDGVIFRFHNNIKEFFNNIIWRGKTYIAAPIFAEGFEFNSKGTLPTPRLSLTVNEEGVETLSILRDRLRQIGDLVGAKVTRIRTFAKYIDAENFPNELPEGFDPDPNVEFPKDIYYIDRKSNENKFNIEFELGSILDVEGIKLPSRIVMANKCSWTYRGEGCLYEYNKDDRKTFIHGDGPLPENAPPIANDRDERIEDIIKVPVVDKGQYNSDPNKIYGIGDSVFIRKNGINYYFVCKVENPPSGPPNLKYWISDQCSKTVNGCRLRWKNIEEGVLPFGGFPAVNKLAS